MTTQPKLEISISKQEVIFIGIYKNIGLKTYGKILIKK